MLENERPRAFISPLVLLGVIKGGCTSSPSYTGRPNPPDLTSIVSLVSARANFQRRLFLAASPMKFVPQRTVIWLELSFNID